MATHPPLSRAVKKHGKTEERMSDTQMDAGWRDATPDDPGPDPTDLLCLVCRERAVEAQLCRDHRNALYDDWVGQLGYSPWDWRIPREWKLGWVAWRLHEPVLLNYRSPTLAERHRANEYADLAGEERPYPELSHPHEWDREMDYCKICGADGRA